MHAVKVGAPEGPSLSRSRSLAMWHYSRSVHGLRQALDKFDQLPSLRHDILWTTHLLGVFELMSDSFGHGWLQHLVHGTSKATVATGPSAYKSGLGRRFFTEIKIFEVCRAIIFNESTFLADRRWLQLTADVEATKDEHVNHSLDQLLNIIVLCTNLRVRAKTLIDSVEEGNAEVLPHYIEEARNIARKGFSLRRSLLDWKLCADSCYPTYSPEDSHMEAADFMSLARAFYAATSIYLSGVFDYEIIRWRNMAVETPTLCEDDIQMHVDDILAQTSLILGTSSISALLILFPLRLAGARAYSPWQQACIMQSLTVVDRTFSMASSFMVELGKVWAQRSQAD